MEADESVESTPHGRGRGTHVRCRSHVDWLVGWWFALPSRFKLQRTFTGTDTVQRGREGEQQLTGVRGRNKIDRVQNSPRAQAFHLTPDRRRKSTSTTVDVMFADHHYRQLKCYQTVSQKSLLASTKAQTTSICIKRRMCPC